MPTPTPTSLTPGATRSIGGEFSVSFSYELAFTRGLFEPANPLLASVLSRDADGPVARILFVLDGGVLAARPGLPAEIERYCDAHARRLVRAGAPVVLPGGEVSKNDPAHVQRVLDAIHEQHVDRHSYVVVVGGGSVIDAAGYAAAIAHRGVRLVRVPTTVLSQNDAAVGVKNGVNAYGKKNFLGTFAPPRAVLCDQDFLLTLSDRDWCAGTSEAVKVALLKDPAFFAFLDDQADALRARASEPMATLVQRCAELHLDHITSSGDPFELGSSRPLDFGHWAAHRLERLSGFTVPHGEAVGIGLAIDCRYARLAGLLDVATHDRILAVLRRLGLPLHHPALGQVGTEGEHAILSGLREFQEHLGGRLTITLVRGVGEPFDVHEIDEALMLQAIESLDDEAGAAA